MNHFLFIVIDFNLLTNSYVNSGLWWTKYVYNDKGFATKSQAFK